MILDRETGAPVSVHEPTLGLQFHLYTLDQKDAEDLCQAQADNPGKECFFKKVTVTV